MPRFNSLALPHRPLRVGTGIGLAVAITTLVALLLLSIVSAAQGQAPGGRAIDVWHLLRMTTIQAGLSTALSLAVGTALAWSLNRLRFRGRELVVGLFASAIVTPGIVVAFGLLAAWGRAGWVNDAWRFVFGAPLDIPVFGLGGILAAHLILDGAFAARILLTRLDALSPFRLKTGQSLGLSAWQRFSIIDWPAIRGTLPGLGAIIFLLAFTSFPIVLLLGGGPANQTLEVAIYAAARLDFDLSAAVLLALVQIAPCSVIVLVAATLALPPPGLAGSSPFRWSDRAGVTAVQWTIVVASTIGFALPLVAVLANGFTGGLPGVLARASFWLGVATSLGIAATAAALTLALALVLTLGRAAAGSRPLRVGIAAPSFVYLAVPAVVLGLGFFLFARGLGADPALAGPVAVIVANALLALPFAVATLGPPLEAIAASRGKLIRSLGIGGLRQFVAIEWPLIGGEAGLVLALAFCFSLGDLGVISLFGTQDFTTLPLLLVRALGAYRTNEAASLAAIMLIIAIAAFVALPRIFERLAHARP